ncbi:RagB/SusD family nutrient uptake outer membrane protein [Olivibacter jilunii]|uniref:RagB/SusD family nutrient uptake outer membrane protein n=1 Tax=Olivibacter jilunii TaxID=985016 RepID=UPI003F181066
MNATKYILLLSTVLILNGACEKALEETPYDFVSPDQLGKSSEQDANLWVNGALNTLNSGNFFAYAVWNRPHEMDCDDITGKDWAFSNLGAGNFLGTSAKNDLRTYWSGPYALIQRCNVAIKRIEEMTFDEAAKNNALGQLHFLKAWAYFVLVQAFGPVPIHKESIVDVGVGNVALPRSPVSDVYTYIIEELQLAETQLYSKQNSKHEIGRISQEAAKTMLAKVYTTMASGALAGAQLTVMGGAQTAIVNGVLTRIPPVPLTHTKQVVAGYESFDAAAYFKLARDKAKEVIDVAKAGGNFNLFPSYMDVWSIANRNRGEHFWQMNATNSEEFGNFLSYQYVGVILPHGSIDGGHWALSDHWYDLFEEQDERIRKGVIHRYQLFANAAWQYYPGKDSLKVKNSATVPTEEGYQPTDNYAPDNWHVAMAAKYAQVTDRTLYRADMPYPFLRYAETLLIFAEAENEVNGPTSEAYEALNAIRRRSNASLQSVGNMDQQQFRSFVLEERRRELHLEGVRAWDLRRWGIYLPVMNAIGVDANNIIKRRNNAHLLFPIPEEEINSNPGMVNNPGW